MSILVGTASWTDKTLIASGRFYPRDTRTPEARLRYYASQFPVVEVDSSYYAMPTLGTTQLWADRTPDSFVMNVKSFRLFTGHQTSPTVLPRDIQQMLGRYVSPNLYYKNMPVEIRDELWRRFLEVLVPLRQAGKLGLVHFQFPPWLVCNEEGHAHVRHCVERMEGHRVSVEFRHRSWFEGADQTASTLAFERDMGAVHTIVDSPQGPANSVPAVWEITHPTHALLRMHGRNVETWNVAGPTASSDRFNYDYSDAELSELVGDTQRIASRVASMNVIFNNNMEDQGHRNAASFQRLIEEIDCEKFDIQ
ncbi:DUF72 domain-containing protein [soil metagenome]